MGKQVIEQQVSGLLAQHGYSSETVTHVDIVKFVQSFGFTVVMGVLQDEEDGFLAISHDGLLRTDHATTDRLIAVNANRSFEWKRFIIAREFGHAILHYKAGKNYLHRSNKKMKDADENDADHFAAALLIPQKSFVRVCGELTERGLSGNALYFQLASIYEVPLESAVRRVSDVVKGEPGMRSGEFVVMECPSNLPI